MHPSQMFAQEVKTLYNGILAESSSSINLKIQILKNLQTYLQEEDTRMQEADRECKYFRCCWWERLCVFGWACRYKILTCLKDD